MQYVPAYCIQVLTDLADMPLQNLENQEISGKKTRRFDQKPGDCIKQILQPFSFQIVYLFPNF